MSVAVSPPPVRFPNRYAPSFPKRRDDGSESAAQRKPRKGADHVALGRAGSSASFGPRDLILRRSCLTHLYDAESLVDIDLDLR